MPPKNRLCIGSALLPFAIVVSALGPWCGVAHAKDVPVNGVVLFTASTGPAYVQITNLLVNGKTELRGCGPASASAPIDKSAYKAMPKISLGSVQTLERTASGTMVAAIGGAPAVCVVPGNFKYEKDEALTPGQMIDRGGFQATVLASDPLGTTALPPLIAGTKIVLGPADDPELASYLRAERATSITLWQAHQTKYPSGPHADRAKAYLAELLTGDGEQQLSVYAKSKSGAAPSYASLKAAKDRADEALRQVTAFAPATQLRDQVKAELTAMVDKGTAKLAAYKQAMTDHTPGYGNLLEAQALAQHVVEIDLRLAAGATLRSNVEQLFQAENNAVATAQGLVKAERVDEAYAAVASYRSFADEEPRLKQIVGAAYGLHMARGTDAVKASKWRDAVAEYEQAYAILPSASGKELLDSAKKSRGEADDRAAADAAIAKSAEYTANKDAIFAYEVFADLTPAQQALVKDQIAALEVAYIRAASDRAQQLVKAHSPIHGRADEDANREAYEYLQKASKLSDDPDFKLRMDLLSETIGDYYVVMAQRYIAKPLASEVPLAWAYLTEAQQYRPNLEAARDERTRNQAAYQIRGKLSIGVLFLDQTSRRDSGGFADMLQDAIATGLETSGLPVKVIRPASAAGGGTGSANDIQPNFHLVGEITEHRVIEKTTPETLTSKFRSGERELPNEEWNKADQTYQAALLIAQREQSMVTAAQVKNKKKEVEEAQARLTEAEKTVQAARTKLNSIPKTVQEDVIRPYNYKKETIELTDVVDLSFRMLDSTKANIVQTPVRITRNEPKKFVVMRNINPNDTEGVAERDAPPDEAQLMTEVEIQARDQMVKQALENVKQLPAKILLQARSKSASNDLDGAANLYILYLNSTPPRQTPERKEAAAFLNEAFNIRHAMFMTASID